MTLARPALLSARSCTKSRTSVACWTRCTSLLRVGGWTAAESGKSPPLELKWLAPTNSCCGSSSSLKLNSATSGLRLEVHAAFVGSIRPGEADKLTWLSGPSTTDTPVVDDPPGRSTNLTREG